MASLSDAKVLGGIGAILILLTALPSIGWLLGIAGFVMVLLAVSNISQIVNDKKIYDNMRTAVILAVGAIAVGTVTVAGAVYHVLGTGSFIGSKFVLSTTITPSDWLGVAVIIIGGLLGVEAFLVASAVFVRRSFNSIGSKLSIKTFETAGLLYLIGAATAIVGIGFILIL